MPTRLWQTLAGLAAVMGKPRGHGNWTWNKCLTEQRWIAYVNNTRYSRPGDTGAMVCLFVTDAERPAFERQYNGSILDFTLMRRQQQPLYCPRLLELHSYWKSYLLVDLMQRGGDELSFLRRTGDIIFSRVMPIGNLSLNLTGFTVGVPILQHALPPNPTEQQAEEVVLGAAGANVDLVMIAHNVLQNVFTPDPSITFEVYETTDPNSLTMIYGPGPRLLYYRDRDILPMTDVSPPNVTRPWEERSVVPLDLLGGRLRRYQVWCRYVEPPSTWLSWCVPFLWAALALVLTALVAAVAWQQRVGYMRSEESMAAADQLRGKARAAERSKSSFVASMSHELRTPMLSIVGLLDALHERSLSAAQLHDVRAARTAAYDTVRLVNRVLDLSKLEARRMPLCCSPFHPQAWLEEVVLGCCERARDKGIDVAGMVDMGVPVVLHMDTMRLSQALNELIDNALCYTTHGHVLVRASVCPATTSLEEFLHHHLCASLHPPSPPRPSFFSWAAFLLPQLGFLLRRATVGWWVDQKLPNEREDDEDPPPLACQTHEPSAYMREEEQVGEARGDGEGDGEGEGGAECERDSEAGCEGDDAGWGRGGGGQEMQLVLSCADTGCGFDSTWEELSEFKVALMGGRVACLSHPGTGSTVAFSVPFARTRRIPAPHLHPPPAPHLHPPPAAAAAASPLHPDRTGGTEEGNGQVAGEGWGCGVSLGGKGGRGSSWKRGSYLQGCMGRGRQGLDSRRCGMQGRSESGPCRGEVEGDAVCTRGVEGVAVGVLGAEGSTRELMALMLAGLGAHVHVLPTPLDRFNDSDARAAEGGAAGVEGSCDTGRAQGGAEELRDSTCRGSDLCGQPDRVVWEDRVARGGVGKGGNVEEGREGMPCVVVVNEEDAWWQHDRRAAAGMRWESEPDAGGGHRHHGGRGGGQQGGQVGGGRGAGVVALAPGEAAAWQAAAVGLVRRCMAAHRAGGRAALGGGDRVDGEARREEGVGGGASPPPSSVSAGASAPRVVVCCRPLLSHRLHHAVQVAAFGAGSVHPGNARHGSQHSPEPARQTQQDTQQESKSGRSEQKSFGMQWSEEGCDERNDEQQLRGEMVGDAGHGAASDASAVLDVVLMDLHMPAMDGFMATEAIRELERAAAPLGTTPAAQEATDGAAQADSRAAAAASHPVTSALTQPRLPILAFTADVDAQITQRCLASGFDGILQKPIDPKQLATQLLQIERPPRLGPLRTTSHPTT
ncbi:unnamed protein product [Closterium sp. Yama58-4]|nr:unnamed protein product [Closterium sp. Yama58-4]